MNVKLIEHLINKIKGKSTWINPKFLKKIFLEFCIFDFLVKKDFSKLNVN